MIGSERPSPRPAPVSSVGDCRSAGHIASPRAGKSLEGQVAPMRDVLILAHGKLPSDRHIVEQFLALVPTSDHEAVDASHRSSWFLLALLTVGWVRDGIDDPAALIALLQQEGPSAFQPDCSEAMRLITTLDRSRAQAFLPYLLDIHGRTSRIDVNRDERRLASRSKRKKAGSFYTPSDVASFMVASLAAPRGPHEACWFDPAVGSGVFLVEALATVSKRADPLRWASDMLFGADISPIACDFAALMIAARTRVSIQGLIGAFATIRANLVAIDVTDLHRGKGAALIEALLPKGVARNLICNPPYVKTEPRAGSDMRDLTSLYLHFIQLATTLAAGVEDAAVFVLPLAIGTNRSAEHARVRKLMVDTGGEWTFLFFDRQPHALFGEDAKTRAAILIKRPNPGSRVKTSSLLKWTSRQRPEIFTDERAVTIKNQDIRGFVPKLGTDEEHVLYTKLITHRNAFGSSRSISKASPSEVVGEDLSDDVFVGGTAYNFLNVFRNYPDRLTNLGKLSASGLHRLTCENSAESWRHTALLSSTTAFWLWHVECDGFHVPTYFLKDLPLFSMDWTKVEKSCLERLGKSVWHGLSQDVVTSVNAGKRTFAFRPSRIREERRQVDAAIFHKLGLSKDDLRILDEFERRTISVDGSDRGSRDHGQGKTK